MPQTKKIFELVDLLKNLKFEERFKQDDGIKHKDTVASHSWRLAVLAMVAADELDLDIDTEKALKIALIHDFPEAVTGDIDASLTYNNPKIKREKSVNEEKAMKEIGDTAPAGSSRKIIGLWQEYRDLSSPEARFIYALDKIEGIYSFLEFNTPSFQDQDLVATYYNTGYKTFPELKPVLDHIKDKVKQEFKKRQIDWKEEYDN